MLENLSTKQKNITTCYIHMDDCTVLRRMKMFNQEKHNLNYTYTKDLEKTKDRWI